MATRVLLIRHGETAWNREKVFRGRHDIPLNDNGRRQAQFVAEALRAIPIHAGFDDPPALAKGAKTEAEALAHYRRVRTRSSRLWRACRIA